jgi:hypothetical protein
LDREQAIAYVEHCVDWIGVGFHPDTKFSDYVDVKRGEKLFNEDQIAHAEANMEACFEVLGDEVYEVALRKVHATNRDHPTRLGTEQRESSG